MKIKSVQPADSHRTTRVAVPTSLRRWLTFALAAATTLTLNLASAGALPGVPTATLFPANDFPAAKGGLGMAAADPFLPPGAVLENPGNIEPPARYVVGFRDGSPMPTPRTSYGGGIVAAVNTVLDFAVIATDDLASLKQTVQDDASVRYLEPDLEVRTQSVPTDPLFEGQYGPRQVRAPQAWDTPVPPLAKTVCVVDTGVRYTHEDLRDQWLGGTDLVNNDTDPWDDNGHGTHVAGIAAATTNNGIGMAGIAPAGILGVKVLNAQGRGLTSTIATGIQWCADHGGDVISMSLGRASVFMQVEQDAARYAWERGTLLVASAGNSGPCSNCVGYPARLAEVIAVTCTGAGKSLCAFSSSGPQSELAAPGFRVLSTCFDSDTAYCVKNGTSMSAPHVSGVASLIWSHRPDYTNEEIRALLQANAVDLGPAGADEGYGHGIVDASSILAASAWEVTRSDPGAPTCQALEPRFRLRGTASLLVESRSPSASVESVRAWIDESRLPIILRATERPGEYAGSVDTLPFSDGLHSVEIRCEDSDGQVRGLVRAFRIDNAPVVRLDAPIDRVVVAGLTSVTVKVEVSRPLGGVFFSEGDGAEVDITSSFDGSRYVALWDSTVHSDEQFPATFEARAVDQTGGSDAAGPVYVTVDNRPDPSVAIVDPAFPYVVAGAYPVRVRASSNVGDFVQVELSINGRPWIDITHDRLGEDSYYLWNTVPEPGISQVSARATDSGGVSSTAVKVAVVGPQLAVGAVQGLADKCTTNPTDCLPGAGN